MKKIEPDQQEIRERCDHGSNGVEVAALEDTRCRSTEDITKGTSTHGRDDSQHDRGKPGNAKSFGARCPRDREERNRGGIDIEHEFFCAVADAGGEREREDCGEASDVTVPDIDQSKRRPVLKENVADAAAA